MNGEEYKALIKSKVKEEAFNEFKHMQAGHEKGNTIYHENLIHPQSYLITNKLNNDQVSLLFNLRTQCVRGIKENFHGHYKLNFKCDLCNNESDTQKHLLECIVLKQHIQWNHDIIKYEHIFGTLQQQITVTILISSLLDVRDKLLEEGTVGWEPPAVLGGGLLYSSLTPTPPTKVHRGAGLPGLNDTGHSDIVIMLDDK